MTSQSAVERLAQALPPEALEELAAVLLRVNHAGTTRAEFHHGPSGEVTDIELAPATKRIRIRRRS